MTKVVVIAQARMGSSRLPGKVLEPLGERTVLEHCLMRASAIPGVDAVCLATSDLGIDDPIAEITAANWPDVVVVRGDATDLLARYHLAAVATGADVILRITCDCPLIDPHVCAAVLDLHRRTGATYASNNRFREWPHGLDCEAFTRDALDQAARKATSGYNREHVGPWIRRSAGPHASHLSGPGGPSARQRWTLDYPEDLAFFRALWPLLPVDRVAPWQEVAGIVAAHPEIAQINAMHAQANEAKSEPQLAVGNGEGGSQQ